MSESTGKGLIGRLFGGKREQVRLKSADEIQAWLVVALAKRLSLPVEQIEADSDRDRWFTAQEALEYGFVDHIITRAHFNGASND